MNAHLLPFKAVIFDLDGVITQTSLLHALAWEKMFNQFLLERNLNNKEKTTLYKHPDDYLKYVDGRPRYEGVNSFLTSRGILLPFGDKNDQENTQTVCGLGNKKNIIFHELIENKGVEIYPSTVDFIHQLNDLQVKMGVASSSKNCKIILEKVNLSSYFQTRIDGVYLFDNNIKGKPQPDIFLTASRNLSVNPMDAIVIEDAIVGVEAAKNGGFGLVIGLARENNHQELLKHGADIVVSDMSEITLDDIKQWFSEKLPKRQWLLSYNSFIPEKEKSRESLLAVGNGYMVTRGAFEEVKASEIHYPGTYMAGLYNKLPTKIQDALVYNEDFVNIPNWLLIQCKIHNEVLIPDENNIHSFQRSLNLKNGLLSREITLKSSDRYRFVIKSDRFISMDNPNIASLCYQVTSLDYCGKITISSILNGNIINDGVDRYKLLNQKHLIPIDEGAKENSQWVTVKTTQSNVIIFQYANIKLYIDGKLVNKNLSHTISKGLVSSEMEIDIDKNSNIRIEKNVFISKDNSLLEKDKEIIHENRLDLLKKSEIQWKNFWDKIDLNVTFDRKTQLLLRLHQYHLLLSASPFNVNIDAGIPARGLHGEAYRCHIFWDEVFILPFYFKYFPEIAKSLLMYRYRRLDEARQIAKNLGYRGASFPWQSASTGEEETQKIHLNPISGKWHEDLSSLQFHVSLAIGYNVWNYYEQTKDIEFMKESGMELLWSICLFFSSKAIFNESDQRYHISKVMGPDEFHEKYPHNEEGGINDNAYTNILTVWLFQKGIHLYKSIAIEDANQKLLQTLSINDNEIKRWEDITQKMYVPLQNDLIEQFEGYFNLKELNWERYREKYGDIHRLDRILKAENLSPDSYKLSKQADVLMLFYLLSKEEVKKILNDLGYNVSDDFLQKNFDYYYPRTSHGSSLSKLVHSKLAILIGKDNLAWQLFQDALDSDYSDVQGGSTAEGIHTGVMAGTVMLAINEFKDKI